MQRGVSIAVDQQQVRELLALTDDAERVDWLMDIEEADGIPQLPFDKDWEQLHRLLGDGELFVAEAGPPLAQAVFGAEAVLDEAEMEFAGLLRPEAVPEVSAAVDRFDETALPQDLLETFRSLRTFLRRAASDGNGVVFSLM